jgi:hypothetical protein
MILLAHSLEGVLFLFLNYHRFLTMLRSDHTGQIRQSQIFNLGTLPATLEALSHTITTSFSSCVALSLLSMHVCTGL